MFGIFTLLFWPERFIDVISGRLFGICQTGNVGKEEGTFQVEVERAG
jgi:hypothetical protein